MAVKTSQEDHIDQAMQLERQGRVTEALSIYHRLCKSDPRCWVYCSAVARVLYGLGRVDEALALVEQYASSVEVVPSAALNDLGVLRFVSATPEQAIPDFVKALRGSTPTESTGPLANLAYALFVSGRTDECAELCLTSTRIEPDERRPHYLLAAIDAGRSEGRARPAHRVLHEGTKIRFFRWLRFSNEPRAQHRSIIIAKDYRQAQIIESVPATCADTPWGVLATFKDEAWCGFSQQTGGGVSPVVPLPERYHLVQRRKWVRLPATGAVSRLEVLSIPDGTPPFDLVKIHELNLSAEGAAVRTEPELPTGAILSLVLELDGLGTLEVQARVIRMSKPEIGEKYAALFFHELDDKTRERIACALHQLQLSKKRKSRVGG